MIDRYYCTNWIEGETYNKGEPKNKPLLTVLYSTSNSRFPDYSIKPIVAASGLEDINNILSIIFSHSGIIMRPHRAKTNDSLLETLVLLKCNAVSGQKWLSKTTLDFDIN